MSEKDRVVIDRYPVERLPADWQEARELGDEVRVILEPVATPETEEMPLTKILEDMQNKRVFSDDPVKRVRALRAEWDRRDEFHQRIRAGDA